MKISHLRLAPFKLGGRVPLLLWQHGFGNSLVCRAIFQSGSEVGRRGCSGASLSRAYYLTEWTGPRHVRNVTRSKACWVGPLCDSNKPLKSFPRRLTNLCSHVLYRRWAYTDGLWHCEHCEHYFFLTYTFKCEKKKEELCCLRQVLKCPD